MMWRGATPVPVASGLLYLEPVGQSCHPETGAAKHTLAGCATLTAQSGLPAGCIPQSRSPFPSWATPIHMHTPTAM